MQGMRAMSKKDLIEFINEKFSDKNEDEVIATFFYCSDGYNQPQQQCILLRSEVRNIT